MAKSISTKLEEAVAYQKQLNEQEQTKLDEIQEIRASKLQIIGRIQTYQELIEEESVADQNEK